MRSLFHLAYNVTDLDEARHFYRGILGCREGRSTQTWIDFEFYGHQLSLHLGKPFTVKNTGHVDEYRVPIPHLGVILTKDDWDQLASRLVKADIDFVLEPTVRFQGQPGEQWTMFFCDPSGNPIEVKSFAKLEDVFAL
ncbi:MAG: VOC family protein [Cyanobacteria bacterium P01_D01_bin.156]